MNSLMLMQELLIMLGFTIPDEELGAGEPPPETRRALARVRCVVDGLRHSTWKELSELRLPEPGVVNNGRKTPAAPPVVQWAAIGRHEAAAPSWSPDRRQQPPFEDDDTRPHALLLDRDLPRRPPVPRTAVRPRPAQDRAR